jgi:putative transposase
MSRPLRLEFPGAIYHVTSRGNAQGAIFADDEDRLLFLAGLEEAVVRFGWLCHAYCQRFNRRHVRVGHLFQGRFKAILVDWDSYLLELCRYVVLNPIRAKMVKDINRYPWSSYLATAGSQPAPEWLTTDWVLSQFGRSRAVARRKYVAFVAQGKNLPSPWLELKGQVLLGSEQFVERMQPLLEGKSDLKEIPRAQRLAHRPSLKALFPARVREDKQTRDETIRRAYLEYGYTMAAIARQSEIHYSMVSKVISGER